jgi:hypothetical protein
VAIAAVLGWAASIVPSGSSLRLDYSESPPIAVVCKAFGLAGCRESPAGVQVVKLT